MLQFEKLVHGADSLFKDKRDEGFNPVGSCKKCSDVIPISGATINQ